jgi:hypothetical protein
MSLQIPDDGVMAWYGSWSVSKFLPEVEGKLEQRTSVQSHGGVRAVHYEKLYHLDIALSNRHSQGGASVLGNSIDPSSVLQQKRYGLHVAVLGEDPHSSAVVGGCINAVLQQ